MGVLALFLAVHLAVYQILVREERNWLPNSVTASVPRAAALSNRVGDPPPACVGAIFTFGVVVPLLETDPVPAAAALAEQLASWGSAPPCLSSSAETQPVRPVLVVAWVGPPRGAPDSATAELSGLLERLLGGARRCFGDVQLLNGRDLEGLAPQLPFPAGQARCNETSVGGEMLQAPHGYAGAVPRAGGELPENNVFVRVVNWAHSRSLAVLWLAPSTHALRPLWLQGVACELADSPGAWIVGSPLLMDCEIAGGWEPTPACCAAGPSGSRSFRLSKFHLGPCVSWNQTRCPRRLDANRMPASAGLQQVGGEGR